MSQDGGEIGRAGSMRTHSGRGGIGLFDVAESILKYWRHPGTRPYGRFDVPCDDAPPFIWNDSVKKELEAQLTSAMRLGEPREVVHAAGRKKRNGDTKDCPLPRRPVCRDWVTAVVNRNRKSFCYFPVPPSTRRTARWWRSMHTPLSTRAPLANAVQARIQRLRYRTVP